MVCRLGWKAHPLENPGQRFDAIRKDRNLQRTVRYSGFPHSLAVSVLEGEKARMAVYGSGEAFADDGPAGRSSARVERNAQLLAATVKLAA